MLMINLDYQNRTPIYEQIVVQIERYVALGLLSPKEQIPSIRELAQNLGINPNTVKKAYDQLENKQIIITISTKGTFIKDNIENVIQNKKGQLLNDILSKTKELEQLGLTKEQIINHIKEKI
ncbi:MAG: GntR family transcriptional regulator [Firmicutes bacterium]|nr:GntR family transcriptional regulator [Bacillota bacterium]